MITRLLEANNIAYAHFLALLDAGRLWRRDCGRKGLADNS